MGLLDFIDDYRAEFWAFVIAFFAFGITALIHHGDAAAFVEAGIIGGIIAALLVGFGKRKIQG